MPFLRLTRDARGYETTALLHASHPGEEPRVLYWYRTAPGMKVGRAALDEDAIRTIEERHPEIEFDWPHILEVGATLVPEVERRPERPRRVPSRAAETPAAVRGQIAEPAGAAALGGPVVEPIADAILEPPQAPPVEPVQPASQVPPSQLLDDLVGREIAARLRERYADAIASLRARTGAAAQSAWQPRADALNPDRWATPEEVLRGVEQADRLLDELRRDFE